MSKTRRKIEAALKAKIALEGQCQEFRVWAAVEHQAARALTKRSPKMAVWREAMVGVLPPTAVDMMLLPRRSLDNAAALPTSPQPQ